MHKNLLIEASAGTGKTQALAERLIELVKAGVKPEELVALTFSRAAAGEIYERFVTLLAERGEADVLRRVLRVQHLMQIGTLDSFLARLVRAYPEELGITGEIEILDDYEAHRIRSRLSFGILRKTDEKLKNLFVDAFTLAMNRENVRSFTESYRSFISEWHSKVAALPQPEAWGEAKTIWGKDVAFAKVTERELAFAASRLREHFAGDEKWEECARAVESFRGSFEQLKKGYAGRLFGYAKKPLELSPEDERVAKDAMFAVYGYVVRMKLELAKGIYKLISAFDKAYEEEVRRAGKLVFDDVPRLINRLSPEHRLSLEYRLDSRLKAWALDEFQDTSRTQWSALENLIAEAKQSPDKSVFVVGDSKQAIYGWREGDVSIFQRERDSNEYAIASLVKTYRSGPAVVEAINRVFTRGRLLEEFPAWRSPEHESAASDTSGFVHVMDASGGKKADFVEGVYTALKARPKGSAAVLVRDNSFGEFLAHELRSRGLKGVVWEGESEILDTPALMPFLDLIQIAEHPGDMLTYRHFKLTRLAEAMFGDDVPDIAALSERMALMFTTRGLVRSLRELRAFLPASSEEAWSLFTEERFVELLRAAAQFEQGVRAGTRLSDFLKFVQSMKKRTVAEADKIKIMTIHRSKGLGFDFVVLPLYERFSLTQESKKALIGEDWILPDPGAVVAKAVGGLEAAYSLRKHRTELEALCLYYVAMTRAKRAMTIICHPAAKKDGKALRFSDIIRSADLDDLAGEVKVPQPAEEPSAKAAAPRASATAPVREARTHIRRRLPSLELQTGISAGSLFASDSRRKEALARGTSAHKAMERVEWSEALPKPEGFVELWRERAFEVFADGEWISGRIDRVVFFRTEAGLAAEIVDFKSSLRHPELYAGQLEAYRRAVHALTGIPLPRISARLMRIS